MEHQDSQTDLPDYDEPEKDYQRVRRYENFSPEVRRLRNINGFRFYHDHSIMSNENFISYRYLQTDLQNTIANSI